MNAIVIALQAQIERYTDLAIDSEDFLSLANELISQARPILMPAYTACLETHRDLMLRSRFSRR